MRTPGSTDVPVSTARTLRDVAGTAYLPLAFAARFPFAMMVVGVLTLVAAARDSIAFAGLASALVGIGTAIFGPFVGAAADRFGQRPVLLLSASLNSAAMLVLALVSYSTLSGDVVLASAFVIGATAPQVSPMSRSRIVGLIRKGIPASRQERATNGVMAYESAIDETTFVFGPVIVGVLATLLSPAAPIIGAALLTAAFVTMFALHWSARTAPEPRAQSAAIERAAPVRDLLAARVVVLVLGTLGVGLFFGCTLTSLTAFMDAQGYEGAAGIVYGIMGIGSTILALAAASFSPRFTMTARLLVFSSIMLGAVVLYATATSVLAVAIALALAGFGIGPTIVTLYSLATERSPRGRSATTMTLLGSGVIVGQSVASAIAGAVAESTSIATAMWLPAGAAALVVLAALANAAIARRSNTPAVALSHAA